MILRALAFAFVAVIYGLTWLIAVLGSLLPRRGWIPTGRIAVTGTFCNLNWYLSHITPLTRSGFSEIILIADEPQSDMDGVRFVCPPKWAARVLTRAGAKCLWMILVGIRYRPDLYMGYHIFPGACFALLVGSLFGRPACYQMTGGPVEIIGGGMDSENQLLCRLGRSSHCLEKLAVLVVRCFDLVVVRGKKAKEFLCKRNMKGTVRIITGSISPTISWNGRQRPYDFVFVGRLVTIKQPLQLVEIVALVSRRITGVKAVVIGDGPLMDRVHQKAVDLGVGSNLEFLGKSQDVEPILSRSKVFLLTSRSEGLSIAMAEAMAAGAVPVVANIGELGDLVTNGVTGYLVTPGRIEEYSQLAISLLLDKELWLRCSRNAEQAAKEMFGVDVVSMRWRRCLQETIVKMSKGPRGMD